MDPQNSGRAANRVKSTVTVRGLASGPGIDELAQFEISGMNCRLLLVDDVLPRHSASRNNARPRLIYAEGEIAHFDLGGHRYALVCEPQPANCNLPDSDHGTVPADVHSLLTNRELQIVQLICMGLLTKQVADRLQISEFTVRSYLKTVYCKLGVRSRGAMVYRYAQAFRLASK